MGILWKKIFRYDLYACSFHYGWVMINSRFYDNLLYIAAKVPFSFKSFQFFYFWMLLLFFLLPKSKLRTIATPTSTQPKIIITTIIHLHLYICSEKRPILLTRHRFTIECYLHSMQTRFMRCEAGHKFLCTQCANRWRNPATIDQNLQIARASTRAIN